MSEQIVILDFGSQYTQVIARRVRECSVYSTIIRYDTPAAEMPDQEPQEIREERNHRLLELVNSIAEKKYDTFIGQQVQILVEGPSKNNAAIPRISRDVVDRFVNGFNG